jgi:hypothetical protein
MKFYITLFALIITMIIVAPAFAGEKPYNAAVYEDSEIPSFYISQKLAQFTHPETFYYGHCYYYFCNPIGPVDPKFCVPLDGNCFICSSKCQERFSSKTAPIFPEVCCDQETRDSYHCSKTGESCNPIDPNCQGKDNICISDCPDIGNSRITKGHSGWYEWVIGLPSMPEGELNIQIECGILKPNSFEIFKEDPAFEAIDICAAETGEVTQGCIRTKNYLKPEALPTITATAYPGAQNDFEPFHLTAYRNPGTYGVTHYNSAAMTVLNGDVDTDPVAVGIQGDPKTRIALKPCMEKSIMVKFPVAGWVNAAGETETDLQAGDLIKVRMDVPLANRVDIYCSQYSVKIGGIGEPPWAPAGEIDCLYDECDQWPELPLNQ